MKSLLWLLLAGLVVSGCDQDVAQTEVAILARRAALEHPELWSVQAADQVGAVARICTNPAIREGFTRPTLSLRGQTCRRLGEPVRTPHGWSFRCQFGPDTYAVSSGAVGDMMLAFETRIDISPLQGRSRGFQQTLRYARLGPCPAGWRIGQAVETRGRGLRNAVTPLDDAPRNDASQ